MHFIVYDFCTMLYSNYLVYNMKLNSVEVMSSNRLRH